MFQKILTAVVLFTAANANAFVSPWVSFDSHNDLRSIVSDRVDNALKLILIREARRTLDIVSYDERCDVEFSRPMLTALRDAANRGVKIRFAVAWEGQKLFDNCGRDSTNHYLLDVPTLEPIKYVVFGGSKHTSDVGWSWFDAIHEKLFIVDGKLVITGGRSWAGAYFDFLDTDFLIRGPLVAQLAERFEAIWKAVLEQTQIMKGDPKPPQTVVDRYTSFSWTLLDDEPQQLRALIDFIESPYDSQGPTGRARVLHNEFVSQLNAMGKHRADDLDINKRMATLNDAIIDEVDAKLLTAREARLIMLFGVSNPKFLSAMIAAHRRGAAVTVFLNRDQPDERGLPITPSWIISIKDVVTMLDAGIDVWKFQTPGPMVQGIYMPKGTTQFTFLHRKLAVIDDTVFLGSHNLDAPSTFGNDELDIEIEDADLAKQYSADLFDDAVMDYGQILDPLATKSEMGRQELLRGLIPDPVYRSM